jgi:hypothetical protein
VAAEVALDDAQGEVDAGGEAARGGEFRAALDEAQAALHLDAGKLLGETVVELVVGRGALDLPCDSESNLAASAVSTRARPPGCVLTREPPS